MTLEVVKPSLIDMPSCAGVLEFLSINWRFLIVTFIDSVLLSDFMRF